MMEKLSDPEESYLVPSIYQIKVKGRIDQSFLSPWTSMEVSHSGDEMETISTLNGQIEDQEALSGLINILVDHRYSIISVMKTG